MAVGLDQRIVDLAQKRNIPYVSAAELWIKMQRPDCLCDGGSYEQKQHPFLIHPECPVHGSYRRKG
jgi:hypothetical protein